MSEPVSYALDGRVATISMDDGKANVFSIVMLRGLHAAFDQAENDQAVVVLRGREGCFSAGFDLKVIREQPDQVGEMLQLGATLAERVMGFPTPVLTACTGNCYPAGAFLLLAADARVGVDGPYKIGLNEVRIGLSLPWFAIEIARHRLTPRAFDRSTVTGRMHSPTEAVEAGFLDAVATPDDFDATVAAWAADLATLDPGAHKHIKMRARNAALAALHDAIERDFNRGE
ncbi:MAG TPA: crotonase/enoyl-CoA hydratase family protein [Acidimicrobiales bacterium]|jgi:enoyl-CoA hydratase